MQISTSKSDPSKSKLDALIIVTPSLKKNGNRWSELGNTLRNLVEAADPGGSFNGAEGTLLCFHSLGKSPLGWIILAGAGDRNDPLAAQRCIGKAVRSLRSRRVASLGVLSLVAGMRDRDIVLGMEEGTYRFDYFKPKSNPPDPVFEIHKLVLFDRQTSASEIQAAKSLAEAVRYTREIANQPPNLFNPKVLAEEAKKLAGRRKLKCEIWDEARLKKEGFGGILAVGQGSQNPPRFIRIDYRGSRKKSDRPFVLVGKAITFDTGGISIKPSDRMDEMKFDKCGGIAVLGIMDAVAALKLPINVTALVSSAENMPSGNAYRPGDLVKTLSGKYAEILNTDAEGRVVLCDALEYAKRLQPRAMVDLATLTGACIICFGHECAAILGNQKGIVADLLKASERSGERLWELPIWPEYQSKVKSDLGFVKNTAGREGGTITAACFLEAFVEKQTPWAHIDIAGVAWTSGEEPHRAKGATGYGVKLVTEWLVSEAAAMR